MKKLFFAWGSGFAFVFGCVHLKAHAHGFDSWILDACMSALCLLIAIAEEKGWVEK